MIIIRIKRNYFHCHNKIKIKAKIKYKKHPIRKENNQVSVNDFGSYFNNVNINLPSKQSLAQPKKEGNDDEEEI